ncbi:MAG TPA: hypothetical protein DD730_20540 [Desulfosporosinus sp.]|jgi:hypothetical protein|nr:hypothetical protein [Desulfosporosinus sp.]
MKYTAPKFGLESFNCPNCGDYAQQFWSPSIVAAGSSHGNVVIEDLAICMCRNCSEYSYWHSGQEMIYPSQSTAPLASTDMPEAVLCDYNEARNIFEKSPKASAALLRLAIQKMCVSLDENGKDMDNDIESLVAKGLPPNVQKALEIVRVVGNNAVHPGEITIDDHSSSIALSLFKLLNIMVDTMITQSKEIDELFDSLPR